MSRANPVKGCWIVFLFLTQDESQPYLHCMQQIHSWEARWDVGLELLQYSFSDVSECLPLPLFLPTSRVKLDAIALEAGVHRINLYFSHHVAQKWPIMGLHAFQCVNAVSQLWNRKKLVIQYCSLHTATQDNLDYSIHKLYIWTSCRGRNCYLTGPVENQEAQ